MKEGYPMYTNHDKFLAALALARTNNDATAMETAKEALAAGRANKEHWAFEYELVRGGFTPPSKRIREVKFLNPATSDCRTWTEEDVFSDLLSAVLLVVPFPNMQSILNRRRLIGFLIIPLPMKMFAKQFLSMLVSSQKLNPRPTASAACI